MPVVVDSARPDLKGVKRLRKFFNNVSFEWMRRNGRKMEAHQETTGGKGTNHGSGYEKRLKRSEQNCVNLANNWITKGKTKK